MGFFRKLKNKAKTKSQQRGGASGGYRGRRVKDHREPDPKPPKKIKIAKMPKKVKKQKPMSIERLPKKSKSLLEDESRMYRGSRVMYNQGTNPDEPILEKRLKSTINAEVKNLQEYGDEFWNSGGGFMSRFKMSMGDSNKGQRLFTELRTINNQMQGTYTNDELLKMANDSLKNSGLTYTISNDVLPKVKKDEGGKMNYAEGGETHTMPDGTVMPGATHQDYMEKQQLPDNQMEDDYMGFIINEALTDEEEDMLMSKLEQDMELSMLFDKVVDVAQEFAGSGPVEGPGSGVSDSIPARLSDGEFVFTAKAVEEIGSDNLMSMMKEAEAQAEQRQQVAMGGMLDSGEEEVDANTQRQTVILDRGFVPEEDDLVGDEIKKRMMDPSTQSRYVRS